MRHGATAANGRAALRLAIAVAGGLAAAALPAVAQSYGWDARPGGDRFGQGWRDTGNDPYVLERSELDRDFRAGERRRRQSERGEGYGSERWNDPWQSEPMEHLELAAEELRAALVRMRRQPPGRRRDAALEEARQALIRTQNAMTWAPRAFGDGRHEGARDGRLFGGDAGSGWSGRGE